MELQTRTEIHMQKGIFATAGSPDCCSDASGRVDKTPGRPQCDKAGMPFYTAVSINLADDGQLMDMMVEAGFDQVFIGIETPDEGSLTECGKKRNKSRNLVEDVKRIQRAGLHVQGGFIVGFDNDTPSIFRQQIDFIQKSGIVMANVAILQAPTGLRLYERLKREGRLLGQMLFDVAYGSTNFVPAMNLVALREGYIV